LYVPPSCHGTQATTVLAASNCEPPGALASPPPPQAASTPPLARHIIMFLIVFLSIKFSTLSPVQVCGNTTLLQ
jgi:hypothetical protein